MTKIGQIFEREKIEYGNQKVVEMAKKMLKQTDRSVLDIANDTGFSSSAYFGKIFRRSLGMTPVEFRNLSAAAQSRDG